MITLTRLRGLNESFDWIHKVCCCAVAVVNPLCGLSVTFCLAEITARLMFPVPRRVWLVHRPHLSWLCDIIRPVMLPKVTIVVPPGF